MMSSRMDERLSELGVRKTYGATNMRLIGQVLWENLLLTCIGGLLGLLISYLIVLTASDWILTLFDSYTDVEKTPFLSFEMLFNPTVFCASRTLRATEPHICTYSCNMGIAPKHYSVVEL